MLHICCTEQNSSVNQLCYDVQSRALLYLFTLTHSVMEAMATAEQAIELATATTSMATASKTAAAAAATATATPATATQPSTAVAPSQKAVSSAGQQSSPQSTVVETNNGDDVAQHAQHAQHGHMDPLQEALQLQHHSQTQLEEEGQDDDSHPLIAGPKGLLQVSLDQRPAKQYFDRSAPPHCLQTAFTLCMLR